MSSRKSTFVVRLKTVTEALPSSTEREEIRQNIQELINFLQTLNEAVADIPTVEDAQQLRHSLENLERRVQASKGAKLFKLLDTRTRLSTGRAGAASVNLEEGHKDLENLSKLDLDALKQTVKDENQYPVKRLRGILAALGLHVSSKKIRSELADLVVTKISNYRGYESLRKA